MYEVGIYGRSEYLKHDQMVLFYASNKWIILCYIKKAIITFAIQSGITKIIFTLKKCFEGWLNRNLDDGITASGCMQWMYCVYLPVMV